MIFIKNTLVKLISYFLMSNSFIFANSSILNINIYPKDSNHRTDYSHNVIQGIAISKYYIFTTQVIRKKHRDFALIFNILDKNGYSIANRRLYLSSHGYDLSVEKKDNFHMYLYTVGEHGNNAFRFIMTLPKFKQKTLLKEKDFNIKLDKVFMLPKENHASTGIALNREKSYLLAVSRNFIHRNLKIKVISGHINIYDKNKLLQGKRKILFHIPLIKEQIEYPVQGIAMYKHKIYVLSGNNNPNNKKLLVIYNQNGKLVHKYYFMCPANELGKWKSWELEGLAIADDYLYTTINAKQIKDKIYLKKILPLIKIY